MALEGQDLIVNMPIFMHGKAASSNVVSLARFVRSHGCVTASHQG
jgi:hypothetical protein